MEKIIFEKVGMRLKQARELRHITLEEAGKKVDVHKSTVLRWENGETEKIKFPVIEVLASFYNVNPVWLMGYDVPMELENISTQQKNNLSNVRMASFDGIDTEGLDEDDIEEINRFVEFIKNKKKMDNK